MVEGLQVRPSGTRFQVVTALPGGDLGGKRQGDNLVDGNLFPFRRREGLAGFSAWVFFWDLRIICIQESCDCAFQRPCRGAIVLGWIPGAAPSLPPG